MKKVWLLLMLCAASSTVCTANTCLDPSKFGYIRWNTMPIDTFRLDTNKLEADGWTSFQNLGFLLIYDYASTTFRKSAWSQSKGLMCEYGAGSASLLQIAPKNNQYVEGNFTNRPNWIKYESTGEYICISKEVSDCAF